MHDKLAEYLKEKEIGHNAFSRKIKTSPPTLTRILKKRKIPSLKIALSIHRETNGIISVFDWFSDLYPKIKTRNKKRNKNKESKNC